MHQETTALLEFPPAPAAGELGELYALTEATFGFVPNAVQLLGISPPLLREQLQYIDHFSKHPRFSPALLTFIRLLVSRKAGCPYCVGLNTALLRQSELDAEAVRDAVNDPQRAPLAEDERALLLMVLKAVQDPHSVAAADLRMLRRHGWSDRDLLEAVHHGARARATDIVMDTFKVTLDAAFT